MKRLFVLLALCSLVIAQLARGQSVLGGTDYGKSQNTAQDLANSLVPGKPNLTKGEKKSEVDPKTLPSKKAPKDPMFSGGLNDIGVDWDGSKMAKVNEGSSANSKSAKQSDATAEKDPKTAGTNNKVLKKTNSDLPASSSEIVKEQKAGASRPDEKTADKEKAANKSEDHH
jgi:hypothetical protein